MASGIRVTGLKETVRSLEKFGVETEDLKAVFTKIGTQVARDAQALVHTVSGDLAASIRPSKTKNKSVIRAGSARVPYAGVQEYGGYNNITPMEYMRGAVEKNQDSVPRILDHELGRLIRKYDLN